MNVRSSVAVLALTTSALVGLSGVASAANSPKDAPGPCVDKLSMPEYCTNPGGDGGGGDPEPKPGGDITDFTIGDRDDVLEAEYVDTWDKSDGFTAPAPAPQTREHILLARQVGMAPTPRPAYVPTGAEHVDEWKNND